MHSQMNPIGAFRHYFQYLWH